MEDHPRPGCSRDIPATKRFKRDNMSVTEDVEEVYARVAAHCEKLRKKEEEVKKRGLLFGHPMNVGR